MLFEQKNSFEIFFSIFEGVGRVGYKTKAEFAGISLKTNQIKRESVFNRIRDQNTAIKRKKPEEFYDMQHD